MDLVVHCEVSSPLFNIQIVALDCEESPFVGQVYNSYDEAKDYYFMYASKCGFSIHKGTTKVVEGRLVVRHFI